MSIHSLLVESGVFDADYYSASYGSDVLQGADPLDHFVIKGFVLGLKPSDQFDPLVFRLRHPGVAADELIRKFAENGIAKAECNKVSSLLPGPPTPPDTTVPAMPTPSDAARHVASALQFAEERVTDFTAGGSEYRLVSPSAERFLRRLREDRPFSIARISHGDWDALYFASHYRGQLARHLKGLATDSELTVLAHRLAGEEFHDYEVFAEHFMVELEADLSARSRSPDFMMAVSFKGYPTADENIFDGAPPTLPVDFARLELFARYFDPHETLYDATLFKRWIISGGLAELPALARQRPVILMGTDYLKSLGARWRLPWFSHITIPPSHSYPLRHALLETCRTRIAEAKSAQVRMKLGKPLFILQGSSFAYWFQSQLFKTDPEVFYWDVGQVLHAWFYDIATIPLMRWGRTFGSTILKNGNLANYYEQLGVSEAVTRRLRRGK